MRSAHMLSVRMRIVVFEHILLGHILLEHSSHLS